MKKGEMTITTIIAIVLAVVILVFLIYGFSTGWNNFWGRVNIFGGGKANVDDIAQACSMACQNQNEYEFCNMERTVIKEDGSKVVFYQNNSNNIISQKDYEDLEDGVKDSYDLVNINCKNLATNNSLGLTSIFEDCPELC